MKIENLFYCTIAGCLFWVVLKLNVFLNVTKEFASFITQDKIFISKSDEPILSYRYKFAYYSRYAICYANFFKINEEIEFQHLLGGMIGYSGFLVKEYDNRKEDRLDDCLANQLFSNEKINLSSIFPPLTYVGNSVFSKDNRLLVYQDTKNIELSKLNLDDTKFYKYKSKHHTRPIYKGVVIYPNNNVVKVVTLCEGTSDYCNLNKLY